GDGRRLERPQPPDGIDCRPNLDVAQPVADVVHEPRHWLARLGRARVEVLPTRPYLARRLEASEHLCLAGGDGVERGGVELRDAWGRVCRQQRDLVPRLRVTAVDR